VERIFNALGLDNADFAELTQNAMLVALDELCAGRLDTVLLVIGHPNSAVAGALKDCDVRLVKASGTDVREFVADNSEFAYGIIPKDAYPELEEDVATFSVMATVMTRNDVSDQLVAKMANTIMDHMKDLGQTALPEGPGATDDRWTLGLTAPLHPAVSDVFDLGNLDPKSPAE